MCVCVCLGRGGLACDMCTLLSAGTGERGHKLGVVAYSIQLPRCTQRPGSATTYSSRAETDYEDPRWSKEDLVKKLREVRGAKPVGRLSAHSLAHTHTVRSSLGAGRGLLGLGAQAHVGQHMYGATVKLLGSKCCCAAAYLQTEGRERRLRREKAALVAERDALLKRGERGMMHSRSRSVISAATGSPHHTAMYQRDRCTA